MRVARRRARLHNIIFILSLWLCDRALIRPWALMEHKLCGGNFEEFPGLVDPDAVLPSADAGSTRLKGFVLGLHVLLAAAERV